MSRLTSFLPSTASSLLVLLLYLRNNRWAALSAAYTLQISSFGNMLSPSILYNKIYCFIN